MQPLLLIVRGLRPQFHSVNHAVRYPIRLSNINWPISLL